MTKSSVASPAVPLLLIAMVPWLAVPTPVIARPELSNASLASRSGCWRRILVHRRAVGDDVGDRVDRDVTVAVSVVPFDVTV